MNDVSKMSAIELAELKRKVEDRESVLEQEGVTVEKEDFLNSKEAVKFAEELKELRTEYFKLSGKKKVKVEIEIEVNVKPTYQVGDLVSYGDTEVVEDMFEFDVSGKLLNPQNFDTDVRSALEDSIESTLSDACEEVNKLADNYEDLEDFCERLSEAAGKFSDFESDYGVTEDELLNLLKKKTAKKKAAKKQAAR